MKYNRELLNKFCIDNDLTLLEDYTIINRNIIITGKCKNIICNKIFNKTFRSLIQTQNFCNECSVCNGKIKSTNTNIKKYGVENPLQNKDIKNKMKKTNLEKYGVENPFQNEDIKNKITLTNLKKYGVEHPLQNEDVKNKIKITNLEKYGFESPLQNEDIKNKIKLTNLKKYGFEYSTQNEDIKNKIKLTNLEKFGNSMALQNINIKEKSRQTMLKKYGVEYISQCPYISEKQYSRTNKIYTLPSGKILHIQGYENYALDILIKLYDEDEILNKKIDMPKLIYEQHNKNHVYFPDFYIPKDNLIIEVKSPYTYKRQLITNILKSHCVRKSNFNYEIWIFDDKKKLLII